MAKTTHLAVGAHQDDIEFMALHGILECFGKADKWFSGVTVTDGGGSPRNGHYENHSDGEMRKIRVAEQRKAAAVGDYACQVQLGFPSEVAKDGTRVLRKPFPWERRCAASSTRRSRAASGTISRWRDGTWPMRPSSNRTRWMTANA